MPAADRKHPLLRDATPEFSDELQSLLLEEGEYALAAQVNELRIVDRCRCGDEFCSTFYTVPRPRGAWGPGHFTLGLRPGMLHVDVLDGRVVCVEVLSRDDIKVKINASVP